MRTAVAALCCTLAATLHPAAALAQEAPWQAVPAAPTGRPPEAAAVTLATATTAPPVASAARLDLEPATPPSVRYDPSPGTRYVLEGLAGLGLAVGGSLVVVLGLVWAPREGALTVAMIGVGSAVATIGIPLGVSLVGHARGGNGGFGWALLGMFGGALASNLFLVPANSVCAGSGGPSCGPIAALGSVLALGSIVSGAVLGYELSNDQRHLRRPGATAALRWSPTALPTRDGLILGAGGVF